MNSTATSINILSNDYPERNILARGRRSSSIDAANDDLSDAVIACPTRNVRKRWLPCSIRNGRMHVSRLRDAAVLSGHKLRPHDPNNPYSHQVDSIEPRLVPFGEFVFGGLAFIENGDFRRWMYRTDQTETTKPVNDRTEALETYGFDRELYQAQYYFHGFKQRKSLFWGASLLWAECDTYKIDKFKGLAPEQSVGLILNTIRDEALPTPSYIVFSGQGFHVKWLLNQVLPKRAKNLVSAMLKSLQQRLAHIGADSNAVDLCRVLRVPGSIHAETGNRVRIIWENRDQNGDIVRYDPSMLRDEILPESKEANHARRAKARQDARERRKRLRKVRKHRSNAKLFVLGQERDRRADEKKPQPRGMHIKGWAWGVLRDLDTLIQTRWNGTIPSGHQDNFVHIAACQLAQIYPADQLLEQARLWSRGKFTGWTAEEQDAVQKTLHEKAVAAAKGEAVEWHGKKRTPVYTYRKATMIEKLAITAAEQRDMQCLIDTDEKNRRCRARRDAQRREAGQQTREEYVATANTNRGRIAVLREGGMSWRQIAKEIGISVRQARRLYETPETVERQDSVVADADDQGVAGCALHLSSDELAISCQGVRTDGAATFSVCQDNERPQRSEERWSGATGLIASAR